MCTQFESLSLRIDVLKIIPRSDRCYWQPAHLPLQRETLLSQNTGTCSLCGEGDVSISILLVFPDLEISQTLHSHLRFDYLKQWTK